MFKVTAKVEIQDSKGTRTEIKNFKSNQAMQDYKQGLRNRVETGATVTVTKI